MKCVNCPETMCKYRGRVESDCVYEEREKMFAEEPHKNAVDWSSFRREAAKEILASIACRIEIYVKEKDRCKAAVSDAIALADELVRQLRKEEEK